MNQGDQFLFELQKVIREFDHSTLTPTEKIEMICLDNHLIMANTRITEQYNASRLFDIIQTIRNVVNEYFRCYNLTPSCDQTLYIIDFLYLCNRSYFQD